MLLSDDLLRQLADEAITVLDWARNNKFDRDRQVEEVVRGFRMTLARNQKEQAT